MPEPTVQVPVSLIERALAHIAPSGERGEVSDELRALLSQPITTARPLMHESGDERYQRVTGKEPPVHIDAVTDPGNYWHDPEPPRLEDLAPGTTFTARHIDPEECGGVGRRWFLMAHHYSPTVINDWGQRWSIHSIDPSTIRNVTPPAVTE